MPQSKKTTQSQLFLMHDYDPRAPVDPLTPRCVDGGIKAAADKEIEDFIDQIIECDIELQRPESNNSLSSLDLSGHDEVESNKKALPVLEILLGLDAVAAAACARIQLVPDQTLRRRGLHRYAVAAGEQREQDLLDEIGVGSEPASESARIESRFAFGLLPGGADPKHLPSVATGLVFATGVSAVAMLRRRLTRNLSRETTP